MLSSPNGNGNPPQTAEADIFETFGTCGPANNGQLNRAIGTAFHSWNMPPDGHHTATGHDSMLNFDMSADFHTYGMLWNGTNVQIYVDRKLTHTEATPSVMHQPMYAIVNLGMNACDDIGYAHDPSQLDVKYIKIWTLPDVNGKGF
jgi:beta-glucanase (GH16 family)